MFPEKIVGGAVRPGSGCMSRRGDLARTSVGIYDLIITYVPASVSKQGQDGTLPKTSLRTKKLKTNTRRNYEKTEPCNK